MRDTTDSITRFDKKEGKKPQRVKGFEDWITDILRKDTDMEEDTGDSSSDGEALIDDCHESCKEVI